MCIRDRAETALADGRLDEAFELAHTEDVRSHRRGQRLIGRLVRALLERGRKHLAAQRWHQAVIDSEKAGKLGGNLSEIAGLRDSAAQALRNKQRKDQHHADILKNAREHIEQGNLSSGQAILADIDSESSRAEALVKKAAALRATVESALLRAQKALERQDWEVAIDELLKAKKMHPLNNRLSELTGQVTVSYTHLRAHET